MTAPQPNRALPSLVSLRFIGALAVFLAHGAFEVVFTNQTVAGLYLYGALPLGLMAVSYFFMLSGFVLTWSHQPKDTARRFWRRRFFRIYPNHLVGYLLALGLMAWVGMSTGIPQALSQLFLVQAWIPDASYFDNLNSLSWSLSAEFAFYLMFPLWIRWTGRINPDRLWYWVGGLVSLVIAAPFAAAAFLPDTPLHPLGSGSVIQSWFVYDLPVVRACEFLIGMLIARIILNGKWIRLGIRPALVLVVVGYAVAVVVPYLYSLSAAGVIPVLLLLGAVASSDVRGRRTPLTARWLVWLGELTFAFYILHGLVLRYGHLLFGYEETEFGPDGFSWSTPVGLAFLAGCFAVTVGLAWLLNTFVERPVMRRWSRPKARPELAPVAGSALADESGQRVL